MNRLAALLAIIIALLSACRQGNDSSCYEFIPVDGWNYRDTLRFAPQITDSAATGALTISLRHSNEYIYSNVYLEVTIADSATWRVDTLNVILADDFGRWYGNGIGTDFQVTDTVARKIALRRGTKISVRHIMRSDKLTDIERVGINFISQ